MLTAWSWVSIGTSDVAAACHFWVDMLGFECIDRAEGDDPGLRQHWQLTDRQIRRQVMLRSPGAACGAIHLVEYDTAAATVRQDAAVFDLCPKNLDIYVDDLPLRMADLTARGVRFRNEQYSEAVSPDGVHFREIHLAGHDDINIVLLQIMGDGALPTESGFYGVGPLVCIVEDSAAEKVFYRDVMGLSLAHDNVLAGPEIEQMIGLPAGCALEVSIWAQMGQPLGEVELVTYQGTQGANRYPRAVPGARGVTHLNWWVEDMAAWKDHLVQLNVPFNRSRLSGRLMQSRESVRLHSPAGLSIEVHAQA
ncbi:VOC family protein [Luminiphilus sp.]|nr:VOC family protein [Luminiphilus sp.]